MDRAFWQAIVAAEGAVPDGHTAAGLTPELLGYLGSPDPELRDDLGYAILIRWLVKGVYAPDEVASLIDPMLANVQRGIGEPESDSVFVRSFSALILAGVVYYDNHGQPFLSAAMIRRLLDAATDYFACERDLRGYIPGKGWAHSCAHTADWLDELALNRHLGAEGLARILQALAAKVTAPTGCIYLYGEDDRMAQAAQSVLARGLVSSETVGAWLNGLGDAIQQGRRSSWFAEAGPHSVVLNSRHFLRCLLVRLHDPALPETARQWAPEVRAALLR